MAEKVSASAPRSACSLPGLESDFNALMLSRVLFCLNVALDYDPVLRVFMLSQTVITSIFDTEWTERERTPAVQVVSESGSQRQKILYKDLKESALLLSYLLREKGELGPEDVVAILRCDSSTIGHFSSDLCILYLELAVLLCGAAFLLVEKASAQEMLSGAGARCVLALEQDFEFLSGFLPQDACPVVSISALLAGMEDRTKSRESHKCDAKDNNSCWISWSPWDDECAQVEHSDVDLSTMDGESILQVAGTRMRGGLLVAEHRNAVEYFAHRWESRHFRRHNSTCQRKILFSPFLQENERLWTADVMAALASGATVVFLDNGIEAEASTNDPASVWDCILGCGAGVVCCSQQFLEKLQHASSEHVSSISFEQRPVLSVYQLGDETPNAASAMSRSLQVQLVSGRVSSGLEYSWMESTQVVEAAAAPSNLGNALQVDGDPLHGTLPAEGKTSARIVVPVGSDETEVGKTKMLRVLVQRAGEQVAQALRAVLHIPSDSAQKPSRPQLSRPAWKVSVGKDGAGGFVEVECHRLRPSAAGVAGASTRAGVVEVCLKGSAGDGFVLQATILNHDHDRRVVLPGRSVQGVARRVHGSSLGTQHRQKASSSEDEHACQESPVPTDDDARTATIFSLDIALNPRSAAALWFRVGQRQHEKPSTLYAERDATATVGAEEPPLLGWQRLSTSFNAPFAAIRVGAALALGPETAQDPASLGAEGPEEDGEEASRAVVYASWRSTNPSAQAFDWRALGEWQTGPRQACVFLHCPAWETLSSDGAQAGAARRLFFTVGWEPRQRSVPAPGEQFSPSACATEDAPPGREAGGARQREEAARDGREDGRIVRVAVEQRAEAELMDPALRPALLLLSALFEDVDAFKLAEERGGGTIEDTPALTYGEIEFVPFIALLQRLSLPPGGSFCDLGCGSGRAVLAAAAIPGLFSECLGVELLPELAEAGQQMCRRWEEAMERLRNDAKESVDDGGVGGGGGTLDPLPQLRVAEGDILEDSSWHHCSLVYVASLCFDLRLLNGLSCALAGLSAGALVLSLERLTGVARKYLVLTGCESMVMSWGVCEVFVYRRC